MGRPRRDPPWTPSGILIKSLSFLGSEMHKLSDGRRWRPSICPILCAMSFRARINIQWVAEGAHFLRSRGSEQMPLQAASHHLWESVWAGLPWCGILREGLCWRLLSSAFSFPTNGWFTFILLCHETLGARTIPIQAEVLPRSGVHGTTGKLHPQWGPYFSFVLCLTGCFITRGCEGFSCCPARWSHNEQGLLHLKELWLPFPVFL